MCRIPDDRKDVLQTNADAKRTRVREYDSHVKDDSYWVLPKALRQDACRALIFGADSSFWLALRNA